MLPGPAFFCWAIHRPEVLESFERGTELIGEWSSTHPGHSIVSNTYLGTHGCTSRFECAPGPRLCCSVASGQTETPRLARWREHHARSYAEVQDALKHAPTPWLSVKPPYLKRDFLATVPIWFTGTTNITSRRVYTFIYTYIYIYVIFESTKRGGRQPSSPPCR